MAEPIKFTFDQAFDGGAKSRFDEEIERVQQEGEDAKTIAHSQGFEEGRAQALRDIEAETQEVLSQIAQASHALFSQQNRLESSLKQEMVQLAYAIAAKLAPALMRDHPLQEVAALIEDCMATAQKEPRLVVRVAGNMTDAVNERIQNMKAATNFPGDLVLIGEETFGLQDCRVEWPDGGTERRYGDIQKEIEHAVHRFVMSDTEAANEETNEASVPTEASAEDQSTKEE